MIGATKELSGVYSIPPGTIGIGGSAFSSCRELTGVIIPDSVTKISNNAFCSCWKLNGVIIPGSVTEIGKVFLLIAEVYSR